jgi:hypothetical protein
MSNETRKIEHGRRTSSLTTLPPSQPLPPALPSLWYSTRSSQVGRWLYHLRNVLAMDLARIALLVGFKTFLLGSTRLLTTW